MVTVADVIGFLRNQPQDAVLVVERMEGQERIVREEVGRIVVEIPSDGETIVVFK